MSIVWTVFSDVGKVLLTKTQSNSINSISVRVGDVCCESDIKDVETELVEFDFRICLTVACLAHTILY